MGQYFPPFAMKDPESKMKKEYLTFRIKDQLQSISPILQVELPVNLDYEFLLNLCKVVTDERYLQMMKGELISDLRHGIGELFYFRSENLFVYDKSCEDFTLKMSTRILKVLSKTGKELKYIPSKILRGVDLNKGTELIFLFRKCLLRMIDISVIVQEVPYTTKRNFEMNIDPPSESDRLNIDFDFVKMRDFDLERIERARGEWASRKYFFAKSIAVNFEESDTDECHFRRSRVFYNAAELRENLRQICLKKEKKSDPLKSVLSWGTIDTDLFFFEEGDKKKGVTFLEEDQEDVVDLESILAWQNNQQTAHDNFYLTETRCELCFSNASSHKMVLPDCNDCFCLTCLKPWIDNEAVCPICGKRFFETLCYRNNFFQSITLNEHFIQEKKKTMFSFI